MSDRICSIDDCDRPLKSRGWCNTHYERWRLHGTTDDTWSSDPYCKIGGCDRPVAGRGWCKIHWQRWSRSGDPRPDLPIRDAFSYGDTTCAAGTCERPAATRGWCKAHYYRWMRWGDPLGGSEPQPPQERGVDWTPTYGAAHWRVNSERGPAREHDCVDCGQSAAHWSYDNADLDELVGGNGPNQSMRYSLDVDHYEPRCVSCHRIFDLAQEAG